MGCMSSSIEQPLLLGFRQAMQALQGAIESPWR
jgi:hypothetical protein